MPQIPLGQKFHTVSADVDTKDRGSALANAGREVFTMQDIADTVSVGTGVASLNTLTGGLTLAGGDNITVVDDAPNSTITINAAIGVESVESLTGALTIVGTGNVTVSDDGASEITINGAATSIDGLSGTVTLVGGGIIDITNDNVSQITLNAGVGQELKIITRTSSEGAPSAAGEVEGTVVTFGTTTGMTAGAVYVWNGTNWVPVDSDAEATTKGLLGVALGASSATDGLLVQGVAYLAVDPGSAGDVLYIGNTAGTTAGQLTNLQPSTSGQLSRIAGYCILDNRVFFSPSQDYIEIA
jgi:hypothetical protein